MVKIDMKTNLPPYWQIKRLGDVCVEIIGGGTPSTNKNEFWDGNIPWITSADIHGIREVVIRKKTNENGIKNSSTNLLPKGSIIVVTRVGLGKIAIAPCDLCFSQDCQGLILKNEVISNSYALYFLSKAVQVFKYESRGTTINGVTKKQLVNLQIPVPPLPEQEQIVAKIEELFSELDAGVANIKTAHEQLKVYRQSLLKWAFEGKLTNEDVKDGELPEGWKRFKVKEICIKILGGGTPSTKNKEYWNGNIPWISSADIHGIKKVLPRKKITLEAIENSATNFFPAGGIIVVTRVGLGKLAIAPFDLCFSQDNQGLILNKNVVDTDYAVFVLSQAVLSFKQNSRGTTINGVTKKQLAELEIPIPPLTEQLKIVEELESRLTVCDKLEEDIKFSLARAESLRQSILKQAFEGKLVNFKGV